MLTIILINDKIILRHNSIFAFLHRTAFLSFGKNARSYLYSCVEWQSCVAAIGVVRFSCVALAAHFFIVSAKVPLMVLSLLYYLTCKVVCNLIKKEKRS